MDFSPEGCAVIMNPATPEGLLRFFGRTDSDSISITAGNR